MHRDNQTMTRVAYILAASHSGSTLLTMLLNSHPEVATIGELSPGYLEDLSWYLCSCGSKIRECHFWRWVTSAMRERGIDFHLEKYGTRFWMPDSRIATKLLSPLHRGPALELLRDVGLRLFSRWPSRILEIIRTNEILVEVILEYYHARVFVDKGNLALRLKYLLRIPSFDVKVIRLLRDGCGVALTYMDPAGFADARDPAMRSGGSGGQRDNERLSMAQAAYQWRRCNEEAEHILRRLDKSRWIEVRYEDICKDTENTLRWLFEFLGLDPDKRAQDFRTVEHHVLGNGMRLDTTSRISLDQRWKSVLTEEELHSFDRVAGEMNRRYEYI
jgi:hypothetical protein